MKACAVLADLAKLLAACDVLLATTEYEAGGLAVSQALYRGLSPSLAHNTGIAEQRRPSLQHLPRKDANDDVYLGEPRKAGRARSGTFHSEPAAAAASLPMHTWAEMGAESIAVESRQ